MAGSRRAGRASPSSSQQAVAVPAPATLISEYLGNPMIEGPDRPVEAVGAFAFGTQLRRVFLECCRKSAFAFSGSVSRDLNRATRYARIAFSIGTTGAVLPVFDSSASRALSRRRRSSSSLSRAPSASEYPTRTSASVALSTAFWTAAISRCRSVGFGAALLAWDERLRGPTSCSGKPDGSSGSRSSMPQPSAPWRRGPRTGRRP